jgi:hypothetical protein
MVQEPWTAPPVGGVDLLTQTLARSNRITKRRGGVNPPGANVCTCLVARVASLQSLRDRSMTEPQAVSSDTGRGCPAAQRSGSPDRNGETVALGEGRTTTAVDALSRSCVHDPLASLDSHAARRPPAASSPYR